MDNEKIIELTKKQMEKVTGGNDSGKDCYLCRGTTDNGTKRCANSLTQISGKLYRCDNDKCSLFLKDQFPAGQ